MYNIISMEEITSFITTLTSKPEWIAYICLLLTLIGCLYMYIIIL